MKDVINHAVSSTMRDIRHSEQKAQLQRMIDNAYEENQQGLAELAEWQSYVTDAIENPERNAVDPELIDFLVNVPNEELDTFTLNDFEAMSRDIEDAVNYIERRTIRIIANTRELESRESSSIKLVGLVLLAVLVTGIAISLFSIDGVSVFFGIALAIFIWFMVYRSFNANGVNKVELDNMRKQYTLHNETSDLLRKRSSDIRNRIAILRIKDTDN